jgi:osmotically-inducible protein OsmY
VASDEDRRRADSIVRGTVGVVCVDNEITTNRLLATRVQSRLDDDAVASLFPVDVSVDGAVVQLSGTVPNGAVHQIVREIVDHTRGVARVEDQLAIRPEDYVSPPVVTAG